MHPAEPFIILSQVLSLVLGLPSFLFALACLVLRRAVARGSLFGFLDTILCFLAVMLPWGLGVLGLFLILFAVLCCTAECHRTASGLTLVMAAGSAAVMYRVARLRGADQTWFYVPGLLSALLSSWLFIAAK